MRYDYNYLLHVHTRQGSASTMEFSHGNTLPLTQYPWGFASFSVQTRPSGNWFFHPQDQQVLGIRLTHQPSPWVGDFGSMIFSLSDQPEAYSPEKAILMPHYMQIPYSELNSSLELAPSERGCILRIQTERESAALCIRPTDHSIQIKKINGKRICGYTDAFSGIASSFTSCKMFFALELENEADTKSIAWSKNELMICIPSKSYNVCFATSFISEEQAEKNLESEITGKSFDDLVDAAGLRWENLLSRIQISGTSEDLIETFYSCLYRTFLYPNKIYELGSDGNPTHFDPVSQSVKAGFAYTNNGFWDTYRTVYPLYAIVVPEEYRLILRGFLQLYEDSGWLPKWPSFAETGIMPGTLIDAVLADAAAKGILLGDDLKLAYMATRKHATETAPIPYGRPYIKPYLKYGYIPAEYAKESVNNSLDYAYGDFCIARIAELLGDEETANEFDCRSKNYRKLFDIESGFMRPKDKKGEFVPGFDPFAWGGAYTEGGPWQSSFSACYDLQGFLSLFGGKENLLKKLDELFSTPPIFHVGGYGAEIHEMTEMASADYGQCAISNEPSFHYPWLYAALGKPEQANYWISRMVNESFSWKEDGFPGDEDNGTMAAWYIFAIMGFYPICPGKREYVKTTPLAKQITVNGKPLVVENYGNILSL